MQGTASIGSGHARSSGSSGGISSSISSSSSRRRQLLQSGTSAPGLFVRVFDGNYLPITPNLIADRYNVSLGLYYTNVVQANGLTAPLFALAQATTNFSLQFEGAPTARLCHLTLFVLWFGQGVDSIISQFRTAAHGATEEVCAVYCCALLWALLSDVARPWRGQDLSVAVSGVFQRTRMRLQTSHADTTFAAASPVSCGPSTCQLFSHAAVKHAVP